MLKEWIASLQSDLAILAGLKSIAQKSGMDSMRRANIRATEKRIKDARREIQKAQQRR